MHDDHVTSTGEPCEGSRGRARLGTSFILPPTGGSRGGDAKEFGRTHDIEKSKVGAVGRQPRVSLLKVTTAGELLGRGVLEPGLFEFAGVLDLLEHGMLELPERGVCCSVECLSVGPWIYGKYLVLHSFS